MHEPLTREDVAGIADYARIALSGDDLDEMTAYLNDALDLLDPLLAYDLEGVDPTYHPIGELSNVARDDVAVDGIALDEVLANAGEVQGRMFRVPSILGTGGGA